MVLVPLMSFSVDYYLSGLWRSLAPNKVRIPQAVLPGRTGRFSMLYTGNTSSLCTHLLVPAQRGRLNTRQSLGLRSIGLYLALSALLL
jgi:hypothetical protein